LIKLAHSSDDEVAAIACFDIGEFVRHYPNGKSIARKLGARDVVMGLIEHDDAGLQRQALLCVSKMLVQNWQVSSCLDVWHLCDLFSVIRFDSPLCTLYIVGYPLTCNVDAAVLNTMALTWPRCFEYNSWMVGQKGLVYS